MAADEVRLKLKLIDVEEVVANPVINRGAEVETLLRAVHGIFRQLAELDSIGEFRGTCEFYYSTIWYHTYGKPPILRAILPPLLTIIFAILPNLCYPSNNQYKLLTSLFPCQSSFKN